MPLPTTVYPSELITFDGAVAGHDGVLSDPTNTVIVKPCTASEIAFYEAALVAHPAFASYMPTFMGQLELASPNEAALLQPADPDTIMSDPNTEPGPVRQTPISIELKGRRVNTHLSIVLSNATAPFLHANILDVKLGAQLWDETADEAKKERLGKVSGETTSGSLGFRIAGMRMFQGMKEGSEEPLFRDYGKLYGRAFHAENVRNGFEEFLGIGEASHMGRRVARKFRAEVDGLREVLEQEESRMIGASLLFVYEGDRDHLQGVLDLEDEREFQKTSDIASLNSDQGRRAAFDDEGEDELDDEDDDDDLKPVSHNLKLIDFAHASFTPGLGPDMNALQGVRSVIRILDEIIAGGD